ncbi:MAG: hypothetical protein S4CHLAM2_00570 [Chlamydiales bacterium]|nr:hypothetical protein [Chlamydiales bacterium]
MANSAQSSESSPASQAYDVQELSIQWLSLNRARKYVDLTKKKSPDLSLEKLIKKVVKVYNQKQTAPDYVLREHTLDQSRYAIRVYVRSNKVKSALAQVLEEGGKKPLPKTSYTDYIFFFHRYKPSREIVAVTSGQAYQVVRPCINYRFPVTVAERVLNPQKIVEITRRCLLQSATKETLLHPSGLELYKTTTLYYLVESFRCETKAGSSLTQLGLFDTPPNLKISTGLLRIEKRIPLDAYAQVIALFSEYMRGETTFTADGKEEEGDAGFEFLHYVQPYRGEASHLNRALIAKVFKAYCEGRAQAVRLLHKHLDDFLRSPTYSILFKERSNYHALPARAPTIEALLDFLESQYEEGFENEAAFIAMLNQSKLRFQAPDQTTVECGLVECLEGELRTSEGESYFKTAGHWYQLSVDYLALVHEDFKTLLKSSLIKKGEKGSLPLKWAGNQNSGKFTMSLLIEKLKIQKGQQKINADLNKARVFYLTASGEVRQSCLVGEILTVKIVKKHQKAINTLLKTGKCTRAQLKMAIGTAGANKVWPELIKKRSIFREKANERFVVNPFLPLGFSVTKKKELVALLEEHCTTFYTQGAETEEAYSREYLERDDYLVFDRICPDHIEPFDVAYFPGQDVAYFPGQIAYLYHIKENFGQPTREACSQVLNAAKEFRAALSLRQTENYVDKMYQKGITTDSKEKWRQKVRAQLNHLQKKGFEALFYEREIVFVYAYLEKESQSLYDESETPVCLTPAHLDLGSKKKNTEAFQALLKEGYIDHRGRLTGKFFASSQKRFSLDEEIYQKLRPFKSKSDSTLAKLELLQLAKELHSLGFKLKICPITRKGSAPGPTPDESSDTSASLEGEAFCDSSSSSLSEVPTHPPRLVNVTNSCYLNAAMQLLFNTPELCAAIEEHKDDPVIGRLHAVLHDHSRVNLAQLRNTLFQNRQKGQFVGRLYEQQDAHEALVMILDRLQWNPLNVNTQITQNATQTDHEETTSHLSIQLEDDGFQEVVNQYFQFSEMQDDGKKWQEERFLKNQPPYLVVHLKRFVNANTKIMTKMIFPDNREAVFPAEGGVEVRYEIVGHVNHIGETLKGGHYISYVKNSRDNEQNWFECNDSTVTECDPNEVDESDAYIVILKKKQVVDV